MLSHWRSWLALAGWFDDYSPRLSKNNALLCVFLCGICNRTIDCSTKLVNLSTTNRQEENSESKNKWVSNPNNRDLHNSSLSRPLPKYLANRFGPKLISSLPDWSPCVCHTATQTFPLIPWGKAYLVIHSGAIQSYESTCYHLADWINRLLYMNGWST